MMLDEPRAHPRVSTDLRAPLPAPRIYNLFPLLVGDIDALAAQMPRIAAMGFDWVFLNSLAESGFSGSLYAIRDHHRLDPRFGGGALLPALTRIATAARAAGLGLMVDLVINHTSRDCPWVEQRPTLYKRDSRGEALRPSAIDPADTNRVTVWGDLAELDYEEPTSRETLTKIWNDYIGELIHAGVRGFRADAAYKVPATTWQQLIGAARSLAPETMFVAETLGCTLDAVERLAPAGFDFLFNSVKWWDMRAAWAIEQKTLFDRIAPSIGFPESHDTNRLGDRAGLDDDGVARRYYLQRWALSLVYSTGALLPIGYEFGFRRKLDVVTSNPSARESPRFDLSDEICRLNHAAAAMPALQCTGSLRRLSLGGTEWLLREAGDLRHAALFVARTEIGDGSSVTIDRSSLAAFAGVTESALVEVEPRGPATTARLTIPPYGFLLFSIDRGEPRAIVPATPVPAAHHPDWSPLARVAIEQVFPEIDGGRFPAKALVGDRVEIWADLFRDGHDVIGGEIRFRSPDDTAWRTARLLPFDNDRWTGDFTVDRPGRWLYTVAAWTDPFESWRRDTLKKQAAGQALELDLIEGLALLADIARDAGVEAAELSRQLAVIESKAATQERARLILSGELHDLVRALHPKRDVTVYERTLELTVDRRIAGIAAWYEFFPRSQGRDATRSSTFDDCIRRLPEIRDLGFDVVYLTPIHPIGRTNRKGRNNALTAAPGDPGSPYAIGAVEGGHDAVHPDLGGIEGFRRFQREVRAHGMEVALDFAVQCSPDHPWLKAHPDWFSWRPDGSMRYAENPPKKYEDIVNVEFYGAHRPQIWDALRDIVLFWVAEGVEIFRVDNPHTKPLPFWEWMIRDVQARNPNVIFLAEAFTRPKMMQRLAKAGFTQSYTYFTWRNTRAELIAYMNELAGPMRQYYRPNFFANTPDILPHFLQTGGMAAFRIRFLLASLLAGVYGIYSGFELGENRAVPGKEEYLDSEKYEYKVWDWDRPGNIKPLIRQINQLRRAHTALQGFANIRFFASSDERVLVFAKPAPDHGPTIWAAILLDPHRAVTSAVELPAGLYHDLLRDQPFGCDSWPTLTLTPDEPCLLLRAQS